MTTRDRLPRTTSDGEPIGTHEQMLDEGFELLDIKVVRFEDDNDHLPWWHALRRCICVGTIRTWCEGGKPLDPSECHRVAREAFGPGHDLLY